ncbi:AI-2E family transporter [Candidatus Peregrinibacteria bacterium]|nr:MAG: AI-2E family transporter [Candidatus Peregrinibacteria bacterium]
MKRIGDTLKKANQHFRKWKKEIDDRRAQMKIESEAPAPPSFRNPDQPVMLEISLLSVFKATLIVMGVILLSKVAVQLVDIAVTFLLSLFLAAAFNPAVNKLESWRIPRGFGIILLFFLVFGFLILLIAKLVPIIADQLGQIATSLEEWIRSIHFMTDAGGSDLRQKVQEFLSSFLGNTNSEQIFRTIVDNIDQLGSRLSNFADKGLQLILGTFGFAFEFVLTFLLTFFLVLDRKNLNDFFQSLFPVRHQAYLTEKLHLVQVKIGEWVHGQIILFFVIGGIAYISLNIIGVEYALTLAMVFGIAEFLPYLGPLLSFTVSAPIAFNESIASGVGLVIFCVFLQFIEGNFIVPFVMKRSVGLPPVVTIIALIAGASFPNIINPVLGMILAVPVATILSIFVRDYTMRNAK